MGHAFFVRRFILIAAALAGEQCSKTPRKPTGPGREMLIAMGARSKSHGITIIQGVDKLHGCTTAWPTASKRAPSCAPWRRRAAM
jgi:hypothetical protein